MIHVRYQQLSSIRACSLYVASGHGTRHHVQLRCQGCFQHIPTPLELDIKSDHGKTGKRACSTCWCLSSGTNMRYHHMNHRSCSLCVASGHGSRDHVQLRCQGCFQHISTPHVLGIESDHGKTGIHACWTCWCSSDTIHMRYQQPSNCLCSLYVASGRGTRDHIQLRFQARFQHNSDPSSARHRK